MRPEKWRVCAEIRSKQWRLLAELCHTFPFVLALDTPDFQSNDMKLGIVPREMTHCKVYAIRIMVDCLGSFPQNDSNSTFPGVSNVQETWGI